MEAAQIVVGIEEWSTYQRQMHVRPLFIQLCEGFYQHMLAFEGYNPPHMANNQWAMTVVIREG
jgi:hypothetical protein